MIHLNDEAEGLEPAAMPYEPEAPVACPIEHDCATHPPTDWDDFGRELMALAWKRTDERLKRRADGTEDFWERTETEWYAKFLQRT